MTRPHRVLYVEACEDGTSGGSHQTLFDLVRTLDRDRFHPIVLFYERNRFVDALAALGVEVLTYEAERAVERAPHLAHRLPGKVLSVALAPLRRARFLRRHKIDLIHLNNSPAEGWEDWLPAARVVGIPCVAQAAGTFRPPARPVGRWLARRHDRVIAVSSYIERTLRDGGVPHDRIRRIAPGVDIVGLRSRVHRSREETRQTLEIPGDATLVLMVGNVRWLKGQDILLSALRQFSSTELAGMRILFVGDTGARDGAYAASLVGMVDDGALHHVVRFLGPRTDIPNLINAADVVVQASRIPEAFGLVVVEGMALGKPVIASRLGGPSEVITADSGITFDPECPEVLAAELRQLCADPELRRRMGESARHRAEVFDIAPSVHATEAVYAELLAS